MFAFFKKVEEMSNLLKNKKITAMDYHIALLGEKMRLLAEYDKENLPKVNIYVDAVMHEKYPKEMAQIMKEQEV